MNHCKKVLSTVAISSLLLLSACSQEKQTQKPKEVAPLSVNVITVKKEPIPIWKRYTGTTKASSEQDVKARVSGILEEVYFQDGQYVKEGEKLFKIQQDEYIADLNAAKAKKAQDEASLSLAIADVNRYSPLVKEGLAPRATLEQYQAQQAGLKAAISGDIAQIEQAKLKLSYTIIKAPISGHVSARQVDVGNLVGQGESTLLTTIVNTSPIYAYFSPSNSDVSMFKKYRNKEKPYAFIEFQGAGATMRLDGFVDFANNSVDALTSTITMRATIDNKKREVLPGTFVYVNLFVNDKYDFLMIPPETIFNDQLGKYVFIAQNNVVKRVNITTDYASKYLVSVTSGLKDGDQLIVSALLKLQPEKKVTTVDVTQTQGIQAILKENNLIPKAQ